LATVAAISLAAGNPLAPVSPPPPAPVAAAVAALTGGPSPLLAAGRPVTWFFAFKTNAATDPGVFDPQRKCAFGGDPKPYPRGFSLDYGVASDAAPALTPAVGPIGAGDQDPVGATFGQAYNGSLNYVVWNDQFYNSPKAQGCDKECGKPWAHSKGMLAWDASGAGFVLQVSTPSWPASGSAAFPRSGDGNTLGCVTDNDVMVSQHFFSLKLTKDDVLKVLSGLVNSQVVTDPSDPQIMHNGGPPDIQALVAQLGRPSASTTVMNVELSSHVRLISKPPKVQAPPWQLVSAELGGVPLLVANWWETDPKASPIPNTQKGQTFGCLDASFGPSGAITSATQGNWKGRPIGLYGGLGTNFNHAKFGVSTDSANPLVVFGDMNQEGALSPPCGVSQNPRGGLFYVVKDPTLAASVTKLISPPS
jgi:hypothetical protein